MVFRNARFAHSLLYKEVDMIKSGNNSRVVSFVEYVMYFFIIALTGTVWVRQGWFFDHLNALRMIVLVFPIVIFFINSARRGFKNIRVHAAWICLFSLAGIISWFVSPGPGTILVAGPLVCYLLYIGSLEGEREIIGSLARFVNVAVIMASVSLFFFFFGSMQNVIPHTGYAIFEWGYTHTVPSYFGLYFESQQIHFMFYEGLRNCGQFCEAPMFNFVLCLALAIQTFLIKDSWKSPVLLITIFTTFSTTGYVALVIMGLFKLGMFDVHNKYLKALKSVALCFLVIFGIYLVVLVIGDKTTTNSYGVRSDHLVSCVRVFCDYFPLGAGFNNKVAFSNVMTFDQGMSVGIPYYLAEAGIMGCLILVAALCSFTSRVMKAKDLKYVPVALVLLWLFFVTSVLSSSVLWLMFDALLIALPLSDNKRKTVRH